MNDVHDMIRLVSQWVWMDLLKRVSFKALSFLDWQGIRDHDCICVFPARAGHFNVSMDTSSHCMDWLLRDSFTHQHASQLCVFLSPKDGCWL